MSAPTMPTPVSVEVNFNVTIEAQSKVQLFGETFTAPADYIVAEYHLPVDALYDASANVGLIEVWEPSDAQGDIKCTLAHTDGTTEGGPNLSGAYQVTAKKLAQGLERMLCDEFDCSGAAPFDNYTTEVKYYKQRDFGRIALGNFAHYLFGHVDATAAITNDVAFVHNMLSVTAGGADESAGGAAARYATWTKDVTGNLEAWSYSASPTDANLALRIVEAIVKKGKASNNVTSTTFLESAVSDCSGVEDASLANIVKQVIGQDSSRLNNVDGSERTKDIRQLLPFYAGDVIYVNIKVKQPTIEITAGYGGAVSGSATNNGPAAGLVTEVEKGYPIKITLA
jgi:hypothetical protein